MAILVSTELNHENTTDTINPVNQSADAARFAGSAGTPGGSEESSSRMLPVTHPASTPLVEAFQFLLCGIDSLDLGLYVSWGSDWKRRLLSLDKKKQQARKNGGLLIALPSGRSCIFKPGGKGENYRFHLQFDAYNLFIGKAARPGTSPNVYLSISAKVLWLSGIETALTWITEDLKSIGGGTIQRVQVSRLDLCADFLVPGGLSHEFILSQIAQVGDHRFGLSGALHHQGVMVTEEAKVDLVLGCHRDRDSRAARELEAQPLGSSPLLEVLRVDLLCPRGVERGRVAFVRVVAEVEDREGDAVHLGQPGAHGAEL